MKHLRYFLGILFLLLCMTACHYRTTLSSAEWAGRLGSRVGTERTPVCTEQQFPCNS